MRMGQMGMGGKSILCSCACSFPFLQNLHFFFIGFLFRNSVKVISQASKRKYSCGRKQNIL